MRATITVRVVPRGGKDSILGWSQDGALRVRVRAAPVDGKANDGVVRLLSRALDLPSSRVSIARGATSRTKLVRLDGIDVATIRTRLS